MEHDLVPTNLSSQSKTTAVRAWVTLACLSMLQFLIAVDVTVVNVALPSIGAEFGANARQLTWVVVGYTITGGGLLMLGGRLGDLLRSEEHTSELQSRGHLVCRLRLEKKKG